MTLNGQHLPPAPSVPYVYHLAFFFWGGDRKTKYFFFSGLVYEGVLLDEYNISQQYV